jgi:hypothetical protein
MAKRLKPDTIEGDVLPTDPESGQFVPAKSMKGAMNGRESPLGLYRPGRLNVRAQQAIMAAANRAAVILTGNDDATEVDYLTHMAIAQPKAFLSLFGKLIRHGPEAATGDGGIVVNAVLNIGGKSLR